MSNKSEEKMLKDASERDKCLIHTLFKLNRSVKKKDLEAYQNLKIYFDNTSVGYYPAKFNHYDWLKENAKPSAVEYFRAYATCVGFFKECDMEWNIKFIHVDAHDFKVFGNEMADKLAQVNDSELEDKE